MIDRPIAADLAALPTADGDAIAVTRAQWANRRIMAYMSLFALMVIGIGTLLAAIFVPGASKSIDDIGSILVTLTMTFGTVVAAYYGFSTYENVSKGS